MISTTEILERKACPIGLFPDAGNYQIFPLKKEMVTTRLSRPLVFIPLINIAGSVILLDKIFFVNHILNWPIEIHVSKCFNGRKCYTKAENAMLR